jgi:hypothetical protein
MHFRERAQERAALGFLEEQVAFDELKVTMTDAARRWQGLPAQEKQRFVIARQQHVDRAEQLIAEQRADLLGRVASLQAHAERELLVRGLPNLLSVAEKFSDVELQELAVLLTTAGSDPGVSDGAMATAPEEPSVPEMNELERLHAELLPQGSSDVQRPWWVRHLAHHRDEWYACAIFDEEAEDDKIYLMLFAFKSPQLVWFLECMEKACIVGVGGVDDEDHPDKPASYRQFEFLDPLVLLPDHRLPIAEDASIGVHFGTIFRGPLLCCFHEPMSFEDFVRHHPPFGSETKPARTGPRPRVARGAVDQLLKEHDWLSREDFEEVLVRKPTRPRKRATRPRLAEEDDSASSMDVGPHDHLVVAEDGHDPEVLADAVDVDVHEELAAMRDEVALTLDDQPDLYFRVVTRGGEWTFNHTGHVADSSRAESRGSLVQEWCQQYQWSKTVTFSINRYGREGSARLAKEFCRRGTFFLRLCHESANPALYVFTPEACAACPDDTDFLDFVLDLDASDHTLVKAHELRALRPRMGLAL